MCETAQGDEMSKAFASQFQALEDPAAEAGVLVIDACLPLEEVARRAIERLAEQSHR